MRLFAVVSPSTVQTKHASTMPHWEKRWRSPACHARADKRFQRYHPRAALSCMGGFALRREQVLEESRSLQARILVAVEVAVGVLVSPRFGLILSAGWWHQHSRSDRSCRRAAGDWQRRRLGADVGGHAADRGAGAVALKRAALFAVRACACRVDSVGSAEVG
jgi:hypothetical protein